MHFFRQMLRFLTAVQLLPALESGEETLVGGQAVLEGVMMRSPHAWAIADSDFPDSSCTIFHSCVPPSCKVVSWYAGNARPERNTAETAASSGVRDLRYSATMRVFSSFLVVAAMASQAGASRYIRLVLMPWWWGGAQRGDS